MAESQGDYLQFDHVISSLKARSAAAPNEILGLTIAGITIGSILIRPDENAQAQPYSDDMLPRRRHPPQRRSDSFLNNGWDGLDANTPRHVVPAEAAPIETFLARPDVTVCLSQAERFLAQRYLEAYGYPLIISPVGKDEGSNSPLEGRSPAGTKKVKDYEDLEIDALEEMIFGDGFNSQKEFDDWIIQRAMDHGLKDPGRTKLQGMYKNVQKRFESWQERKAKDSDASSGGRR